MLNQVIEMRIFFAVVYAASLVAMVKNVDNTPTLVTCAVLCAIAGLGFGATKR